MGGIAGTLAHIGNRMREDHLLDLEDRIRKQDQSLDFLSKAYQNPEIAPEDRQGIFQLLLDTSGTPAAKYEASKTSKKFADLMAQSHSRAVGEADQNAQQTPANVKFQIPGGTYNAGGFESHPPLAPAAPPGVSQLPSSGNPFLDQIQQYLRVGGAPAAQPLPEPPAYQAGAPNPAAPGMLSETGMQGLPAPGSNVPGAVQPFFSPERAAQQKVRLAELMAPAEAASYKAQYGAQYGAQHEAERTAAAETVSQLQATINPATGKSVWSELSPIEQANVLTGAKRIIEPRTTTPSDIKEAGGALWQAPPAGSPPGTPWKKVTEGTPSSELTKEQQEANAMYEARMRQTNPNFKLTPNDYAKARSLYDEERMTPDQVQQRLLAAENIKQLQALRSETMANTAMHMNEWKATHGPEAISSIVKQMQADPDVFFAKDMPTDLRNAVAQAWTQQTGLPPPREVPAQIKTKEANSVIALNAVTRLKKMLAESPVIQKRMGAWDGRVGNLEQAIGTTAGLSPQDARTIQDFRSSVNYLFFQEGAAILQRSPQQLMEELRSTSPSMKQGLPLFLGAVDAVTGTAANNIQSANDYRFNRAPGSQTSPTPPNPPGGGSFSVSAGGKTYTFKTQAALDAFKKDAGIK